MVNLSALSRSFSYINRPPRPTTTGSTMFAAAVTNPMQLTTTIRATRLTVTLSEAWASQLLEVGVS